MLQLLLSIYRRDAMARNTFFLINLTNQKLIFCLQCSDSDIIQHIFSEQHHFLFLYFCSLTAVRLQRFTYSSRPFPVSHCHADWTFYSHSEMMSSVSYTPTHTQKKYFTSSPDLFRSRNVFPGPPTRPPVSVRLRRKVQSENQQSVPSQQCEKASDRERCTAL